MLRGVGFLTTTISGNCANKLIKLNRQLIKLTRSEQYAGALLLFSQINSSPHLRPDHYTLSAALTACANLRDRSTGNQLHANAIRAGLIFFPHVSNTLLLVYAKSQDLSSVKRVFNEIESPDDYSWTTLLSACAKLGDVEYACQMFDKMPQRNVAVWNAMITGCAENGSDEIAFRLFQKMHSLGVGRDNYSLASVLSLCSLELLDFGLQVHSLVIKSGLLAKTSVINALLTMYFACGRIGDAHGVFEEEKGIVHDQITYNAMIAGLVSMERKEDAFLMFKNMQSAGLWPTELSFVSIMSSSYCLRDAIQVHAQAIKMSFEDCTSVSNAAITMYSNCGNLNAARVVFERLIEKDNVSWNTMITSYANENLGREAILVYSHMQREGAKPDEFTIGSLLVSSESVVNVEMIHAAVVKNALLLKVEVSNALLSAFSRHGYINQAYRLFYTMNTKNLISWNTLISGYQLNGFPVQGLEQFSVLVLSGFIPNIFTLSIVLNICASISALRHGKQVHAYTLKVHYSLETSLNNAFITLYAKCGDLCSSLRIFHKMTSKDTVSWNSMISAYAQNGEGREGVRCFELMQDSDTKPDEATFTAVLSACSHSGLVNDGCRIFNSMVSTYGIEPDVDHFSCLIDILGRAGYLDETERLISSKHVDINSGVWWTLFSSCAAHGNLRLGRVVAGFLLQTEKHDPAVYVLLSKIYADAGKWTESADVRELIKKLGVMKQPGRSWIRS
ncbi:pentatricopeptide repeat-containing protein At3g49740 [Coffea arabica]|uniref:Pentatricopeptide repeat-containing protein At3g49740 n=1 Tax=Coffea arabica TaxID=13443 RepID=A0A6P6TMK9_COFAR|nr:pentatricopeptide repeat-containing protein At3g49740-like [Coffea arabica]